MSSTHNLLTPFFIMADVISCAIDRLPDPDDPTG